jgi:hypothetical protein
VPAVGVPRREVALAAVGLARARPVRLPVVAEPAGGQVRSASRRVQVPAVIGATAKRRSSTSP